MIEFYRRARRWRVVAGLMCCGLAGNTVFGMLSATGIVTTFSDVTTYISLWAPPAVERIGPTLRIVGRLKQQPAAAFAYLIVLTVVSLALAVGLWKTRKWAAWLMTAFALFPMVTEAYGIVTLVRLNESVSALINHGRIPAFAWWTVYLVLLWADWISGGLRRVRSATQQLRRERVPLG